MRSPRKITRLHLNYEPRRSCKTKGCMNRAKFRHYNGCEKLPPKLEDYECVNWIDTLATYKAMDMISFEAAVALERFKKELDTV